MVRLLTKLGLWSCRTVVFPIRELVQKVRVSFRSVQSILSENLAMPLVSAKFVAKLFTMEL